MTQINIAIRVSNDLRSLRATIRLCPPASRAVETHALRSSQSEIGEGPLPPDKNIPTKFCHATSIKVRAERCSHPMHTCMGRVTVQFFGGPTMGTNSHHTPPQGTPGDAGWA